MTFTSAKYDQGFVWKINSKNVRVSTNRVKKIQHEAEGVFIGINESVHRIGACIVITSRNFLTMDKRRAYCEERNDVSSKEELEYISNV